MFKLTEAGDLEKAGRSIGNFFTKQAQELEKSHGFHAAASAHHDAMKATHSEHAAHYKATHDGMANDHDMKAHMAKGHTHHTQMAAHHEALAKAHAAHAETLKAEIDAMKAMAAEWGGGTVGVVKGADGTALVVPSGGIEAMIHETTQHLTKKALESFDTDPAVQEKIREMVLKGISATLGDKIIPTAVSAVTPNRPGITAVPRAGAPAPAEKIPVPMEFEKLADIEA